MKSLKNTNKSNLTNRSNDTEKYKKGKNKMIKVATLFSGVGTPEQSLKHLKVEHETVFACEIDRFARTTYLANNQEPKTFYDDVYNIDGNKYKDQIDILIAGSPCQSFSIAGKRMGTSCPRGNLIYEYFRIVEEAKPKVFIYENVKGFLSIDKIDKKEKYGETFKNFVQSFKELGYTVYYEILNTKDYGVPQNRERIYIVGFKDEVEFEFAPKQELKLRLKDMLEDEVDKKYHLDAERISSCLNSNHSAQRLYSPSGIAPTISAGSNGGGKEPVKMLYQTHTLNIKGNDSIKRIYSTEGLCPSLTTMQGGHREPKVSIEDKYVFRKLTPRECFRLQGFDDSFIFPPKMSDTQLYKQAGNGMSRNILDMIFTQIFIRPYK